MYGNVQIHVNKKNNPEMFSYCEKVTVLSKNLKNTALFTIRQWFTSKGKDYDTLQPLQKEVYDNVKSVCGVTEKKLPGKVLGYAFMDKHMRMTENPDYYAEGLPRQCAQWVLKETTGDFRNWLNALKRYNEDPAGFTGKPKMPHYTKSDKRILSFTNQDCRLKEDDNSRQYIKFPLTNAVIQVVLSEDAVLKEVKVKPIYGEYVIYVIYEGPDDKKIPANELLFSAGIDLGVDNIATFVSNDGNQPLLYKGDAIKAMNQWYNKQRALRGGILMKGHAPGSVRLDTKYLNSLSRNRSQCLRDWLQQMSTHIIRECVKRKIGTLYIGKNTQWKTGASMSEKSNQKFVQIPFNTLIWMITYKAKQLGITVVEQEESYTSKSSFLDNDDIPVYGHVEGKPKFSGFRIKRGLYKSSDGTIINADVNGAANILRKADPNAFVGVKTYSFLQEAKAIRFTDIHPRRPAVVSE